MASWSLSKIGRISVHWVASHWRARPRRHRSPKRPMAGMWPSPVPMCPHTSSHDGARDGDRPWARSLRHARGWHAHLTPGCYRKAEADLEVPAPCVQAEEGQPPSAKGVCHLAKAHQTVRRQRRTSITRRRWRWCGVRHDLSRGLAGPQPGKASSPRQVHQDAGWSRSSPS